MVVERKNGTFDLRECAVLMGWGKELMKAVEQAVIVATLLVQNCVQLKFFLSALLISQTLFE